MFQIFKFNVVNSLNSNPNILPVGGIHDGGEPLPSHRDNRPDGPIEGDLHDRHQVGEQDGGDRLKLQK